MSKSKNLKNKTIELALASTAHGLPNIIKTENLICRIIWLTCFLLSITCCVYNINNAIQDFLSYNVVTQIDTIFETKSQFPSISFCSDPEFDSNLKLEKSILKCEINKDTSYDHFTSYNDTHYGKCFRFNSQNKHSTILNSTQSGYEYGFQLKLNLENSATPEQNRILTIYIHNYSYAPLTIYNKGFQITAGNKYLFNIERVFNLKLDNPYNDCLFDINTFELNKTIINYMLSKNISYSQRDCFELCFDIHFLNDNTCKCNTYLGNVYEDCVINSNNNKLVKDCYFTKRISFYNQNPDEYCSKYCPFECNSYNLNIIPSFLSYPSTGPITKYDNDQNFNSAFKTYEEVRRNYFEFNVYYSDLKYLVISETPKTQSFDLISSVGGIFGVFIGISFLSFIEIIELFIEVIFILVIRKNLNNVENY